MPQIRTLLVPGFALRIMPSRNIQPPLHDPVRFGPVHPPDHTGYATGAAGSKGHAYPRLTLSAALTTLAPQRSRTGRLPRANWLYGGNFGDGYV